MAVTCEEEFGEQFRDAYPDLMDILDDEKKSIKKFRTLDKVERAIEELKNFKTETRKSNVTSSHVFADNTHLHPSVVTSIDTWQN